MCDRVEGSDRIIIFCTERCLKYLANSSVWYGNGTFSVAPTFFYQLYTIHGVVMGQLLPLAYCILTRKTRDIYQQMFLAISDHAVTLGNVFYYTYLYNVLLEIFGYNFIFQVYITGENTLCINIHLMIIKDFIFQAAAYL